MVEVQPSVVIMVGRCMSGKGTHGKMLADLLGAHHIEASAMLRGHVFHKESRWEEIKRYINSGHLVPNGVVLELLEQRFDLLKIGEGQKPLVLDGVPRNTVQGVRCLQLIQERYGFSDDEMKNRVVMMLINVPEWLARQRFEAKPADRAHRTDDRDSQAIENRLAEFPRVTIPMFKELSKHIGRSKVSVLDPNEEPKNVFQRVVRALRLDNQLQARAS